MQQRDQWFSSYVLSPANTCIYPSCKHLHLSNAHLLLPHITSTAICFLLRHWCAHRSALLLSSCCGCCTTAACPAQMQTSSTVQVR